MDDASLIALWRKRLVYEPETGIVRWRMTGRGWRKATNEAGSVSSNGYRIIKVDGVTRGAARIIWAMVTGKMPAEEIDHKDLDQSNNRWNNLREATRTQNGVNRRLPKNNTSGLRGVHHHRYSKSNPWLARISLGNQSVHLGVYPTAAEAHAAYVKAAKAAYGEFVRSDPNA